MRQDAIFEIGFDVLKSGLATRGTDLLAEDGESKSVAQLVPVQRREGQRTRKSRMKARAFCESDCVR